MKEARIAALVGDYYHKPESMVTALTSAAGAARLDSYTDPALLPWDDLHRYSTLIIAREARLAPAESAAVWIDERLEHAIQTFVEAGGGLVALHAGLASYGRGGPYFKTVRGGFLFHPEEHPRFSLRRSEESHPILEGFRQFEIQDEMYFVRVDSARTTRLLETASADFGSSAAAWAHASGAGRVFCFTPGHRAEVLSHPAYLGFLEKGVLWASGLI